MKALLLQKEVHPLDEYGNDNPVGIIAVRVYKADDVHKVLDEAPDFAVSR